MARERGHHSLPDSLDSGFRRNDGGLRGYDGVGIPCVRSAPRPLTLREGDGLSLWILACAGMTRFSLR